MENSEQSMFGDVSLFLQLAAMFQIAARQQMGKMPNPLTNQVESDLQQAKASIDMLEMLKEKTQGNLSDVEREFLDKVLFELHMEYVDEVDRAAKEGKEQGKDEAEERADEPPEADSDTNGATGES